MDKKEYLELLKDNGRIIRDLANSDCGYLGLVLHLFNNGATTHRETRAALGLEPIYGKPDFIKDGGGNVWELCECADKEDE